MYMYALVEKQMAAAAASAGSSQCKDPPDVMASDMVLELDN
jgi:hypothetical protein